MQRSQDLSWVGAVVYLFLAVCAFAGVFGTARASSLSVRNNVGVSEADEERLLEAKGIYSFCPNTSNPYHTCSAYCRERYLGSTSHK